MFKKLTTWSHAHTFVTVAIVATLGYLAYDKYVKKEPTTGGVKSFTGGEGSLIR